MTDAILEVPSHSFIVPVSPRRLEGRCCWVCSRGYSGGDLVDGVLMNERKFVELRIQLGGADPVVAPGTILTEREEGGRRVIMHRDPATGASAAITVEIHPVMCADCLKAGAYAAGMPPATDAVLIAEREQRERADVAELERDNLRAELDQIKSDLKVVQALERLFAVENEASSTETPTDGPKSKTTRRRSNAN